MAKHLGGNKWEVVENDTLPKIAAQAYGNSRHWPLIWRASNFRSDVPSLIYAGEIAICPDLPEWAEIIEPGGELSESIGQDEVSILIGPDLFTGWQGVTINRSIDTCDDEFALTSPFDPERKDFIRRLKPFGYQTCRLYLGNEMVLKGLVEKIEPVLTAEDITLTLQGRSLTGTLVDSCIDSKATQFNKQTLKTIATWVCDLFGVGVEMPDGDTDRINETRVEPGQTAFDYLNQLAQGKGMLISSNGKGTLIIKRSNPNQKTVASIVEGESPLLGGMAAYDGTQRFSRYKVLLQADGNPSIFGVVEDMGVPINRPKIVRSNEIEGENRKDAETAAAWRRTMALAESVDLSVTISDWRTPEGALWNKGVIVTLKAPSLMVYKESPFTVAGVTLRIDEIKGRVADLRLVLPETYTTDMPEAYPRDKCY
ncbi:hypothetical protein ES703_68708 [subsurface metagenome]